eukprot:5004838-Amphidinium_carterae.1
METAWCADNSQCGVGDIGSDLEMGMRQLDVRVQDPNRPVVQTSCPQSHARFPPAPLISSEGGSMKVAGRQNDVKTEPLWTQLKEDRVTTAAVDSPDSSQSVYIPQQPKAMGHPRIKILSYKRICHRILAANLQIDGRRFNIVACHAPVRDAPESHHVEFQSQLIPWTSPIKGTSHVLRLLDACQKDGVSFLNTIFPPVADDASLPTLDDTEGVSNAVATWKKASAPSVVSPPCFQIDYIMGNRLLYDATQYCQPLPWAQMDALRDSDHRPVLLQAVLHGHDPKSAKKGRPLLRKFVNEDHQAEFDKVFRATMREVESKEKFQNAT